MNPNMFNPEFMNQMKNMINPQMMKQAAQNFDTMSDDQIKAYLSACGMGHVSPQMFRQMSGNLKNMDDKDIERIKTTNLNNNVRMPMSSNTIPTNTNTTASSNANKLNGPQYDTYNNKKTQVQTIEEIKNKGNELFKQAKYKEACEKYYEALNELEYIPDSDKINFKKELDDLEIICRLNIANSKLKLEDYDLVINECLKVLKKSENFKAHYRAGLSFYKKGNYTKSHFHFSRAKDINKTEEAQQIDKYLKECQIFIDETENAKKINRDDTVEEKIKNENETESELEKLAQNNHNNVPNNIDFNENSSKKLSKYEKMKEIVQKDLKLDQDSSIGTNKKKDEILIEEVDTNINKTETADRKDTFSNSTTYNNHNLTSNNPFKPEIMSKAEEELKNMDEGQMNQMVNMIKSMDNQGLKSMMKMQGMDMTDEQISMMKNSLNPEMMKMMKNGVMPTPTNINTSNINSQPKNNIQATQESSGTSTITCSNQQTQSFPSIPDMKNMDINSMLKFVQSNPQLLNMMGPQMSQMFGQSQSPGQSDVMMNSMQNILWILSLPQRIKAFFYSSRGMLLIFFFIILIFSYFFR